MEEVIKETGAVSMVVLPQKALEEFSNNFAELKQLIQGQALEKAKSQWIESEEARKILGLSPKTWQTYRDNRLLPFSQFGRKIFVKLADIEAFFEAHMIRSN